VAGSGSGDSISGLDQSSAAGLLQIEFRKYFEGLALLKSLSTGERVIFSLCWRTPSRLQRRGQNPHHHL
jgi:hypothetical protein